MKGSFFTYVLALTVGLFASNAGFAQTAADHDSGSAFDLVEITAEWNEWFTEPTSENEFIGTFMDEFQVPQSGQHGLNRMETWYWWASHHPTEVSEYVTRRNDELGEEE